MENRTTMYEELDGEVIVHQLPFKTDKLGMTKLQRYLDRGFTFEDPRVDGNAEFCPECLAGGREVLKTDCNFHKEVDKTLRGNNET